MKIKDIAELTGVSISTVSKIVNNKDHDISAETRNRVLKVIEEHNYTPYSNIKLSISTKNIGIIIPTLSDSFFVKLLDHLEKEFIGHEYSITFLNSRGNSKEEKKCVKFLLEKNIDGLIVFTCDENYIRPYSEKNIKQLIVGARTDGFLKYDFNFEKAIETLTLHLLDQKHTKIALLTKNGASKKYIQAYKTALSSRGIKINDSYIVKADFNNTEAIYSMLDLGISAVVTSSKQLAALALNVINSRHLCIPGDISVVTIGDNSDLQLNPAITSVDFDLEIAAKEISSMLIAAIENKNNNKINIKAEGKLTIGQSTSTPKTLRGEKIVIIGTLNADTHLRVNHIPEHGETVMTSSILQSLGGKGANQAVGIGKLHGDVHIIGRVGRDQEGQNFYNALQRYNVGTEGLEFDNTLPTGKAFISVDKYGNDTIIVDAGANSALDKEQITRHIEIIKTSQYVLLQMEIPHEMVRFLIDICYEYNKKIILKPSPAVTLPDKYYKKIFLFVPNQKEAQQLCPNFSDYKEQANFFVEKGVKNTIITLGDAGCYYSNGLTKKYYKSAPFKSVDSTGASDCFVSALTFLLAQGKTMDESIVFANYAAGISVTKVGVQNAMIDYTSMNSYIKASGKPTRH